MNGTGFPVLRFNHGPRLPCIHCHDERLEPRCQAAANRRLAGFILAIHAKGNFELLHDVLHN